MKSEITCIDPNGGQTGICTNFSAYCKCICNHVFFLGMFELCETREAAKMKVKLLNININMFMYAYIFIYTGNDKHE